MSNILHLHRLWIHKESIADARNNTHPSSSKASKTVGKEIQGILVITVFVMKKKITINPNQRSPGNHGPPTIFYISLQNFNVAHPFTHLFSDSANTDYMIDNFMGSGKIV